jgi:hypothetical protein
MKIFSDEEKLAYRGEVDDMQMFSFTCFNPQGRVLPSRFPLVLIFVKIRMIRVLVS